MPLEEKTAEEPLFGLLFFDQLLFDQHFWARELWLPMTVPQKVMHADTSDKRLCCTGRKTSKTILLEGTLIRLGCVHDGDEEAPDEAMFFTPGESHMVPVRDRIVSKMLGHPIFRHFRKDYNKNEGTLDFETGIRWYLRVEGISGSEKNMVGPRTIYMLGDELAFGNKACETGRKQTALPGCKWMYCGVPNGVRNSPFFELDQTHVGNDWSRHKLTSYDNPLYIHQYGSLEAAMEHLSDEYDGMNTQGYVTQVEGKWGEEAYSAFPPQAIATRRGMPFTFLEFHGEHIKTLIQNDMLASEIRLPRVNASRYVIGMDYGYAQDPSVLMIFYEASRYYWQQLARIRLWRTATPHQAKVVDVINRQLLEGKMAMFCTDRLDVIASMLNTDEPTSIGNLDDYESKTVWSNPMGTVDLTDDQGKVLEGKDGKPVKVRRKQWMTDLLRKAMAYANAELPHRFYMHLCQEDSETIEELVGTTQRKTVAGYVIYDPAIKGDDHNTDGLRDAACAIDWLLDIEGEDEGWQDELEGLGWVQLAGVQWQVPWDSGLRL